MQGNKSKWSASSEQEVPVWLSTIKHGSTVLAYRDTKTEGNKKNSVIFGVILLYINWYSNNY